MKQIVFATLLLLSLPFAARPLNVASPSHCDSTRFPAPIGAQNSSDLSAEAPKEANPLQDSRNWIASFLASESSALCSEDPAVDTPLTDSAKIAKDTLVFDLSDGFFPRHRHPHVFSLSGIEPSRQVPYTENFSILDFNRVTGFFLGLGSPGLQDIGHHDEIGLGGGFGYGFASKRWEYRMDGELRLPLADVKKIEHDTSANHML